ncbi:hypothetical protein BY996DRAFT_6409429 [Phakopsora pachyrhizi]|nr:hypothetical protein BY996DRAFT_6409429 [Phakopsora pachyrhizi]
MTIILTLFCFFLQLTANLRLRLNFAKLKVQNGWHNQTLNEVETLYQRRSQRTSPFPSGHLKRSFTSSSVRLPKSLTDLSSDTEDSKYHTDSESYNPGNPSSSGTELTTPEVEASISEVEHQKCLSQSSSSLLSFSSISSSSSSSSSPTLDSLASNLSLTNVLNKRLLHDKPPIHSTCSSSFTSLPITQASSNRNSDWIFGHGSRFQPTKPQSTVKGYLLNDPVSTQTSNLLSLSSEHHLFDQGQTCQPFAATDATDPFGHPQKPFELSSPSIWPTSGGTGSYDDFWKTCSAAADEQIVEPDLYSVGTPMKSLMISSDHKLSEPRLSNAGMLMNSRLDDLSMLSPLRFRSGFPNAQNDCSVDSSLSNLFHQPLTPLQLQIYQRPNDPSRNSPITISKAHRNRLYSAPSGLDEEIDMSVDDLDRLNWPS